jgi:CheY-like chemotaxis protein
MNHRTILLVEDNPDDELLTIRALRKSKMLNEIIVAHDGAEALAYLFGEKDSRQPMPELVLLDLRLPKVDGLEVLRQLRQHPRTKLLPVVVLTTSDEERDVLQSYDLGANSYIRKPVDFAQFMHAIQQLELYWLVLNVSPPLT